MSKTFTKTRLALLAGLTLSASVLATSAQAELSGEVSLTNDYRFRGISQTAGDPALQAGVDWSAENGFFVGAWASNIDFDEEDYNGPDIELDIYAGYYGEINDNTSWDVTLYRYNYPGDSELDYLEATVGVDFSGFRAAYWYTNDYSGSDLDLHYMELNYGWEFTENWSLDVHYGYNFGDALDDGEGFDSYSDYSVGVSTEVAGFGLSLAYLMTDLDGDNEVNDGVFKTKDTFLASVSYAF
ncbi:TorF family putative porin [Shewanella sp. OMA3-2]|uniref:TorF family putative porin n=1 Tax=Shewanella sp. OMA3-2 TaxID=2908650 RepID=UPI001F18B12A|nr:TorF family putative porin [Shewanella sp. OMA3-2]UJF21526.1 TorF family putative porin [Shewanella sp. OMA3-2]